MSPWIPLTIPSLLPPIIPLSQHFIKSLVFHLNLIPPPAPTFAVFNKQIRATGEKDTNILNILLAGINKDF